MSILLIIIAFAGGALWGIFISISFAAHLVHDATERGVLCVMFKGKKLFVRQTEPKSSE